MNVVEKVLKECWDKEVRFELGASMAQILIDDEVVFAVDASDDKDYEDFTRVELELADFYASKILEKVRELTGISELEGEYDPDFSDYYDVYTPTLYAEKLLSVKVGKTIADGVWKWRPLKEVLADVEKELKEARK